MMSSFPESGKLLRCRLFQNHHVATLPTPCTGKLAASRQHAIPFRKKHQIFTWGWKRSKNDIEFGLLPALAVHLMHVEFKKIAALAG